MAQSLWWVLFTDSIQGTCISIENHSGLMLLQTILRMWTQSSWRWKENALSCLFSRPSMDWQEIKVHNTVLQRGPYVWKGQRNRKYYLSHTLWVKHTLDFPCGWKDLSKTWKCIAKFGWFAPSQHFSNDASQKIGHSVAPFFVQKHGKVLTELKSFRTSPTSS